MLISSSLSNDDDEDQGDLRDILVQLDRLIAEEFHGDSQSPEVTTVRRGHSPEVTTVGRGQLPEVTTVGRYPAITSLSPARDSYLPPLPDTELKLRLTGITSQNHPSLDCCMI